MEELRRFVEGMPKSEFHTHIEGCLTPEQRFRFAERNGISMQPYANVDELKASYIFHDLPSFLAVYEAGMDVLRTEEDFSDLAYEYLAKASSQRVVYSEIFFDPQSHTARGVEFATVVQGLHAGLQRARAEFGIRSHLIMCFVRDRPVSEAMATLEASFPFKHLIIGVGLDSNEHNRAPELFREVFKRARDEGGYHVTAHCDVNQQNTHKHIAQCLSDELAVERIDHGLNTLDAPELLELAASRGIGFTMCPISNSYVTGNVSGAEMRRFIARGIPISIASDDPAYMGQQYVLENLIALLSDAGWTREDFIYAQRSGVKMAWHAADRAFLEQELENYLKAAV